MPEPTFPRPSTRDLAIWSDIRAAADAIKAAEFYLGFLPAKPREIDFEAVRMQLDDARALLGQLALAHAENIEARS